MIVKVETTEVRRRGVRWMIWVNGEDHGGGIALTQSGAYQQAAMYLRDMENRAVDDFLTRPAEVFPAEAAASQEIHEPQEADDGR